MVAVFSGNGLGLFDTSLMRLGTGLGGSAGLGQGRDSQRVNAANGNLVLQSLDESLLVRGLNASYLRTYNSRGTVAGAGQDGWTTGFERNVVLTGLLTENTSSVAITTGDGQIQVFAWVAANTYRSTAGDGAHDTAVWNAGTSTWTVTEGSSRREEIYADHAGATLKGRLIAIRDFQSDGTTPAQFDILYNAANLVAEVRSVDGSGASADAILFGYDGSNRLVAVDTREGGAIRTQVSYGYDAQGRLSWVQQDLTPDIAGDGTWDAVTPANNNGLRFRTSYSYVTATAADLRIAAVTQSDGSTTSYTYEADGAGGWRVKTAVIGSGADAQSTTFTYGSGTTDVTTTAGGISRTWTYQYDANKQLVAVLAPATGGQRDTTNYTYDAATGDVKSIVVSRNAAVVSQTTNSYDTSGNLLWQWTQISGVAAASVAVQRTYNGANQILTETRYTGVDADGPGATAPTGGLTTQFVYDERSRLRFLIDATGGVTERVYATSGNGIGQVASERRYVAATYSGTPSEAALVAWATPAQKAGSQLTDYAYDGKGRLTQANAFAAVDAAGAGVLDAATEVTRYTYDAQGLLRQQVELRGTGRTLAGAPLAGGKVTSYVHDGLGRLTSAVERDWGSAANDDALTRATTYAYLDSGRQIVTTLDSGATETRTHTTTGQVATLVAAGAGVATRTVQNFYDGAGQLRSTQDAAGGRRYFFYDPKGRLEALVDETGAITQTTYDAGDRVLLTVAYANRVDTTTWLSGGTVTKADIAAIGIVADAARDRVDARTYDAAGRMLTRTDGAAGSSDRQLTTYTYDGAGRVTTIVTSDSAGTPATARTQRFLYDAAGRQTAAVDAQNFVTEFVYDAAGRLVATIRYANASATPAATTLAALRPVTHANDQTTRVFYNGRGQATGSLDAAGYLTEVVVDEAGNQRTERRYAKQIAWAAGDTLTNLRDKALTAPPAEAYRDSRQAWNGLGQLKTQTNAEGTVTRFTYDEAGRLVRSETAADTGEVRDNFARYNAFGEMVAEITGEQAVQAVAFLGGKLLTDPTLTPAQLDAAYAAYGITYVLDARGRRIESRDALGNKVFTFYDGQGRQTWIVRGTTAAGVANAEGEVTQIRYTAFGDVQDTTVYTGRITLTVPGDRASVQTAIGALSYTAALDSRRQLTYTARGLVATQTDALGVVTSFAYTAFGQVSREIRAQATGAAVTIDHVYDARDLETSRTEGVGTTTTRTFGRSYDAFGRIASATDARGSVVAFTYDRLGREVTRSQSVTSEGVARNEIQTTVYDAFGRTVSQMDALGRTTTYAYSDAARSLVVRTPENLTITTVNNRFGQALTITDGLGATTTHAYDDNGNLTSTRQPGIAANATQTYTVLGQVAESTDATGRRIAYTYDAAGRVLNRIEDPGTGRLNLTTQIRYDGQGRQVSVTDASGRLTTMSFDPEGRLLQTAQDPAGLNLRTVYTWDAQGRQLTVVDGAGTAGARTTRYAYDALGRRTAEIEASGSLDLTTTYLYDGNDNVVQRTDGSGRITRFVHDGANRLTHVVDGAGGVTKTVYDAAGHATVVRRYAAAITISDLGTTAGVAAATIKARTDAVANDAKDSVDYRVYDKDGRLRLRVDGLGQAAEIRYDAANRVVQTLTYLTPVALAAADKAAIQNGSIALATALGWVSAQSATALVQGTTYDAAGRVLRQTDALGNVSRRVYDAAGRAIYTIDPTGAATRTWYDPVGRVAATRQFATPFNPATLSDATTSDQLDALLVWKAEDQGVFVVYDDSGRARYTLDLACNLAEFAYDAAGRRTLTRSFAGVLVPDATLNGKLHAGTARVADIAPAANAALDQASYVVADAAGRTRFVVDALGNVEETRYDAAGRPARTLGYLTAITLSAADRTALAAGTFTETALAARVAAQEAASRQTRMVYDSAGRLRYTIDGIGAVVEQVFDGAGRVAEVRRHPTAVALAGQPSEAQVATALGTPGPNLRKQTYAYDALGRVLSSTNALGHADRFTYDAAGRQTSRTDAKGAVQYEWRDAAGRLRYRIDALGQVQEFTYDGNGNVRTRRTHAAAITVSPALATKLVQGTATAAEIGALLAPSDSRDTQAFFAYDAAGRVRFSADAVGNLREQRYDALGRTAESIDYAVAAGATILAKLRAGTAVPADFTAFAAANAATARSSYSAYDAAGRPVFLVQRVDGTSAAVTEWRYDAQGRRTAEVRYGKLIAYTAGQTSAQIQAALTAAQANLPANQRLTRFVYDADGRERFRIDDAGAVVELRYNALGEVAKRLVYPATATIPATPTEANMSSAVAGLGVRTTTYAYDLAGRLSGETDSLGKTETYTYDALGQRTGRTDRLDRLWTTVYDAVGQVVEERTPAVAVAAVDAAGNLSTVTRQIVTRMTYDSVGNLATRTDNADAADARTVAYAYDARGNQIRTTFPDAHVYDEATGNLVATGQQPTIEITYDTQGRAVVQRDVRQKHSYKVYDALGRVAYEVDAENYATRYLYNAYGEQTGLVRYAARMNAGPMMGWVAGTAISLAQIETAGVLVAGSADRRVDATYDARGQKVRVEEASVSYWSGTTQQAGRPTTQLEYDAYGNLVKESVWLDAFAAAGQQWAVTYHYYDDLGRRTLSVDAEGYATAWQYNAAGEVVEEIQYARALATGSLSTAIRPGAPASGDAATGYDRITRWGYDALGRKATETLVRHFHYADGSAGVRDVVTQLGYDHEGHVTTINVDGVVTTTRYDELGRKQAILEAERDVLRTDAEAQLAASAGKDLGSAALYERRSPVTSILYDGFGNVVETRRSAAGATAGVLPAKDDARDQVARTRYDRQGRAVWQRDAEARVRVSVFDAADNVVNQIYWLDGNDGRAAKIVATFTYDAANRQTASLVQRYVHATANGVFAFTGEVAIDGRENVTYNAFGEIVSKGFDGATQPLLYTYDAVGRLLTSNADGGTVRTFGYNLAGFQLREAHQTRTGGAVVGAVTTQTNDRLGRMLSMSLPAYSDDAVAVPKLTRRVDRWGNTVQMIDTRGYETTYEINADNRITRETKPLVKVLSDTGVETWQRPVTRSLYDALGRLVASIDANGNVDRIEYDPAGRQVRVRDAYGNATVLAYDALGNQRLTQDPMGYITYRRADRMGRVVEQGDFMPDTTGVGRQQMALQTYTLNANGDRLSVRDATGATSKYDYDGRSLLLRSQTPMGVVMAYRYDSQGRKVLEQNALSNPEFTGYLRPQYQGGVNTTPAIVVGQAFNYTIPAASFQVPSGEALQFRVDVLRYAGYPSYGYQTTTTSGISFDPATRRFSGVPAEAGTYSLVVTARSSAGYEATVTISLSVLTQANYDSWYAQNPQLNAGLVNQNLQLNTPWSFQVPANTFVDAQSSALAYTVNIGYWVPEVPPRHTNPYEPEPGEPAHWEYRALTASDWIQYNAATRTLSGTPNAAGSWRLQVIATDADGRSGVTEFTVATDLLNVRLQVADADEASGFVYRYEQSWDYDAFGRLVDHNDLSGIDADYSYDPTTGQQTWQGTDWTSATVQTVDSVLHVFGETITFPTQQLVNAAGTREYFYYANGQLKELREGSNVFRYAYDAAGNRTLEETQTRDANGTVLNLRVRMTYDSHNRLQRIVQEEINGSTSRRILDLTYDYDANGNRRRVLAQGALSATAPAIDTTNRKPVVIGLVDGRTVRAGIDTSFRLNPTAIFRDPELDALGLTALWVDNGVDRALPAWLTLSLDPDTGELVFRAGPGSSAAAGGDFTIKLVATEGAAAGGKSESTSFVLSVRTNSVPVLANAGVAAIPVKAGDTQSIELASASYFLDPDLGDSLTLSLAAGSALPAGITLDAGNPSALRLRGVATVPGDYTIYLRATDLQGASVTKTLVIQVRANAAPVAQAGAEVARTVLAARSFVWQQPMADVFVDADDRELSITATLSGGAALPSWLSVQTRIAQDTAQLQLLGTPPSAVADGTVYTIVVTARDAQGLTATKTFQLTVRQNLAPAIVGTIPAQTLRVGVAYSLETAVAGLFNDPEGELLDYVLVIANGDPTAQWLHMAVNRATGKLALWGTPPNNGVAGNRSVQIVATDPGGRSSTITVSLQVKSDNAPVYGGGIGNQTVYTGRNFSFGFAAGTFSDADGDVLTYVVEEEIYHPPYYIPQDNSWEPEWYEYVAVPAWLAFNGTTRTFSGTAPATTGSRVIRVTARDETGREASADFTLAVAQFVNSAPTYTAGSLPARSGKEGQALNFALPAGAFVDANGDPLTYTGQIQVGATWVSLPTLGLSIEAGTGRLFGTPTAPTQSSYNMRIVASDGLATATGTFVLSVNRKPATPGSVSFNVVEGQAFSYSPPGFSDPEGGALTFTATLVDGSALPAWLSVNGANGTLSGTPPVGMLGVSVRLTATDNAGLSSIATVSLNTINPPPQYVAGSIPASFSVPGNVAWTYQVPVGAFTNAPVSEAVTYRAYNAATGTLPAWLTFNATTRTFSGTPPVATTVTLIVEARDTANGVASASFALTGTSHAPVYNGGYANAIVNQGAAVSIAVPAGAFTDANQQAPAFSGQVEIPEYEEQYWNAQDHAWDFRTVPASWTTLASAGLAINASTGQLTGTASLLNAASAYRVKVIATDPQGLAAQAIFNLTINQKPVVAANTTLSVGANQAFSRQVPGFYDPEGQVLTYSAVLSGGAALSTAGLSLSSAGLLSGNRGPGTVTLIVTATDTMGLASSTTLTLTIANSPPVYVAGSIPASLTSAATVALDYQVPTNAFTDANGDALTYSAVGQVWIPPEPDRPGEPGAPGYWETAALPAGLTFNAATRTLGGAVATPGTFYVSFIATDPTGWAAYSNIVTVQITAAPNRAPTVPTGLVVSVNARVAIGSVALTGFADPEGGPLTYTATGLPAGVTLSSTGVLTGTAPVAGSYSFTVKATDNVGQFTSTTVTLASANVSPVVAQPVPNQSATLNQPWSYQVPAGSITDGNGDPLTWNAYQIVESPPGNWHWDPLPSWMNFNAGTRTFSGTPTAAGPFDIALSVSDGAGWVNTSFRVTVASTPPVNVAPVLSNPIDDTWLDSGTGFNFAFAANTFTDGNAGDTLTYTATLTSGAALPAWLMFNAATRTFYGTAVTTRFDRVFNVRVTARDPGGLTATDDFTIEVFGNGGGQQPLAAPMAAPTAGAEPVQTFTLGAPTSEPAGALAQAQLIQDPIDDYDDPDLGDGYNSIEPQKTYWYTYDKENRVVVAHGQLLNAGAANAQIALASYDVSYALTYDAVGRAIGRISGNAAGQKIEVSNYNLRGQVTMTFVPVPIGQQAAGGLKQTRHYDAAGREIEIREYFAPGTVRTSSSGTSVNVGGWLKHVDQTSYNLDGQVLTQTARGRALGWKPWGTPDSTYESMNALSLSVLTTTDTRYNAVGQSAGYSYRYAQHEDGSGMSASDPKGYTHTYWIQYEARDSFLEKTVGGHSSNSNFRASSAISQYDSWGRRIGIREQTPLPSNLGTLKDRMRYFAYDAEGGILRRREGTVNAAGTFVQTAAEVQKDEIYAYANGQQYAKQTRAGQLDVIARLTAYENTTGGSSQVQVQTGDTLQTIAQRVYGNASLWYVLAEANAVSDSSLVAGTSLRVPEVKTTSNSAASLKPYNPAEVIGSTTPGMPYIEPPPAQSGGCGMIGMIIMIVVAVVVTVFTAGALAAPAGASLSTIMATGATALAGGGAVVVGGAVVGTVGTATAIGAAFVGGVAGSIASQAVGKALGVVDHISFKDALFAGVTSMAGVGIGKLVSGPLSTIIGNSAWAKAAASAALNNIAGYAVNKAAGRDVHFSWRSVAASAVTAGLTAAVAPSINKALGVDLGKASGQFGADLAGNLVGGVVGLHVRRAFGFDDKVDYGRIAADAFGNTLGNALSGKHRAQAEQFAFEKARMEKLKVALEEAKKQVEANRARVGELLDGLEARRAALPEADRDNPLFLVLGDDIADDVKRRLWADYQSGKIRFDARVGDLNDAFAEFMPDSDRAGGGTITLNGTLVEMMRSGGALSSLAGAVLQQGYWEEQGHQLDEMARAAGPGVGGDSDLDEGAIFAYLMTERALASQSEGAMQFSIALANGSTLDIATSTSSMKLAANYTMNSGRIFADYRDPATGRETYGPEGHYFTTGVVALGVARALRIPNAERVAAKLALWSQIPDMAESLDAFAQWQLRGMFNFSAADLADMRKVFTAVHNLAPTDGGTAEWLRGARSQARELVVSSIAKGDYALAGMAIHKLGDSYAHTKNGLPYEMPHGHGWDSIFGNNPDVLAGRQALARAYATDLANTLARGFGATGTQRTQAVASGLAAWNVLYDHALKAGERVTYNKAGVHHSFDSAAADAQFRASASLYLSRNFRAGDLLTAGQIETYHPVLPPWDNTLRPGLSPGLIGSDTPWSVHDRMLQAFGIPSTWNNRNGHEPPPQNPWYNQPGARLQYWPNYNYLQPARPAPQQYWPNYNFLAPRPPGG